MTPKELLYIEDALGHEQEMAKAEQDLSSQLQDGQLKSFVTQLSEKHRECFSKFYQLL